MTDQLLQGAALVYFDGRLTDVAVEVATRARQLHVPVRPSDGRVGHGYILSQDTDMLSYGTDKP